MKSILIIAFKFPPMGGIGTRRMAKFAKYLAKENHQVHILTINYPFQDTVNWLDDIDNNDNIIIHRIKAGIPLFLLREFKNIWLQRLQYLCFSPLKKTKYFLDVAQNWQKYLIPKAIKIIDEYSIKNIIVTNPPVSVAYQTTFLKQQRPNINLIQDFRDAWNDDMRYQTPHPLTQQQRKKSLKMEDVVIEYSDKIITTTNQTKQGMINRYKQFTDKFQCIYNGYDESDFENLEGNNNQFNIIYAGSLGSGREFGLYLLLDSILLLDNDFINEHLVLNIFSEYNARVLPKKYYSLLNKNIIFHDKVKPKVLMSYIAKHRYCLSINAEFYTFAIGAKTFDYMGMNKKILLIAPEGELYDLLKEKNQFVSDYDIENVKKCLLSIKDDFLKKANNISDFDEFNISILTKKIIKLFK
jgi:glycosyltransferase involved in cell wall biosynthesis